MNDTAQTSSVFASQVVSITIDEEFQPDKFLRTKSGLWVSDRFRSLVVTKAKPTKAGTTFKIKPQTLVRDATDAEIENELGEDHLFDETEVSAVIGGLIMKQSGGGDGALLNDGRANLLYLCSCVVDVYWAAAYRDWRVRSWGRGGSGWFAGFQVFSPAN